MLTLNTVVTTDGWKMFDGVDLPEWMDENTGKMVCSFLNSYIPKDRGRNGCRYHLLNHWPSGQLYFHLLSL